MCQHTVCAAPQGVGAPASCPRGMQFAKVAAMYLLSEVEKEQRWV